MKLLRSIANAGWYVRVIFRHMLGRWFVFRDAPMSVCISFAALASNEKVTDRDLLAMAAEAEREVESRLSNLRRCLERGDGARASELMATTLKVD